MDVEKKARELLADEIDKDPGAATPKAASSVREGKNAGVVTASTALRAIARALEQPASDDNLPEPFPRVHSYDPSGNRRTVTVEWSPDSFVSYIRSGDRKNWNEPPPSAEQPASAAGVEGWRPIETAPRGDGVVLVGWGEYRERDGYSPAFMRWYDLVGGWTVNAMPFYPTHWMPLPAAPKPEDAS